MKSGIYTITNLVTGQIYVGLTIDFKSREEAHLKTLRANKHSNIYLQRSWNKYNENNFVFEILIVCEENFLFSEEHYWATMLNVFDRKYGFNIKFTNPNGTGRISEETKLKISKANKNKPVSLEKRQNLRNSLLNCPATSKKIIQSDLCGNFIKEYSSIGQAARELNIRRASISGVLRKRYRSTNGFLFNYKGEIIASKEKSRARRKPVLQYDLKGNFIKEWNSISEAALVVFGSIQKVGEISACCYNKRNRTRGYKWEFK